MNAITLNKLELRLDGFSLKPSNIAIPQGHITALIGKNGAGKTTLFKTLHGLYHHYTGQMSILGMTYRNHEKEIRTKMGVMYDALTTNPNVLPQKILQLTRAFYPGFDNSLFDDMVQRLDIKLDQRLRKQSLGMQRKFIFALTLATRKEILLLDEPFNGIDPIYKKIMMEYIQTLMENDTQTVIISSHQVDDLEKISDYVMIMDKGTIKLNENKESLLESYAFSPETKIIEKTSNPSQAHQYPVSLEDIFVHLVGGHDERV